MLNREVLSASEAVYDGCQEQPIDLDISLPDYCPDIQRILKCQVTPCIASRNVSGDRLEIEGSYVVRVYYLDPSGSSVRCYATEGSYLSTVTLNQPVEQARVYATTRLEYINCRPTSPRRLDIHGAFSVCARVYGRSDTVIVTSLDSDSMEQQCGELQCNTCAGFSQQPFTVEDTLQLPSGKLPAETILRTEAAVVLKTINPMQGQVMAVGEIRLGILYAPSEEGANPERMDYELPFTQLLDCDGMTEQSQCRVQITVSNVETQVHSDFSGETTTFETHVRLLASVTAFAEKRMQILTDAYSRRFEVHITCKQKNLDSLQAILSDTYMHRFTVACDSSLSKVLDLWCEPYTVTANVENGQVQFRGKLTICVLALNQENTPFYFERTSEFTCAKPLETVGETRCFADAVLLSLSYHLTGSEIEIGAEMQLTAEVYTVQPCKFITNVEEDESHPRTPDPNAVLCIYFAVEGEKLWDIARQYCTSVEAIREENGLEGDQVESRGMLLIPM